MYNENSRVLFAFKSISFLEPAKEELFKEH
jgi:hypothetical protein